MSKKQPAKTETRSRSAPTASLPRAPFWEYAALALIAVATFIAYLPAMQGSLVWNDSDYVTRSGLRSLQGLGRIWFDVGATEQYYPLLHSFFWMQSQLWNNHPLGYHLVNVLLHLAAVGLLYLILRKLHIPGALLAAGIFALHPVMVESVGWITEQKNTLSTVFYLAAILVYLDFDRTRKPSTYFAALSLYLLAMASKTVTATLPAALLVILWWQRGSLSWRRDVRPLAPWFVLGIAAGLFTAWVERTIIGAEGADFTLTEVQRLLIAGRVPWFYAAKLLWPVNLIFMYPRWDVDPKDWWQWLFPLGLLVLFAALWSVRNRWRGPLASGLLFVGTLFPVLGFLNVYWFVFAFAADHLQYLASIALIVLAAAGIASAIALLRPSSRPLANAICVVLLGVLGALTWHQSQIFANDSVLYQTTIARNPTSWLPYNNMGALLLNSGETQQAVEFLQEGLRRKPTNVKAHVNLGNALAKLGRPEEAIKEYELALKIGPTLPQAHYDFGCFLLGMGRIQEAVAQFQQSIELNPNFVEAYINLGSVLVGLGRTQEGIEQYQKALRLDSTYAEAYYNLALAEEHAGQMEAAIQHYRQAIALKPAYAAAHTNLGKALANAGQLPGALEQFQQAVQLQPDSADAHNNLAIALAQSGQLPEAVEHYQQALRLEPERIDAWFALANVYAQMNRGEEANAAAQKAIELARAKGQTAAADTVDAWLKSRGAGSAKPTP